MSITLPPLPVILARVSKAEHDTLERQFRARDLEVAQLVLEAAAKVCRDFHATDSLSNYGLVMARMIDEVEVRHHE